MIPYADETQKAWLVEQVHLQADATKSALLALYKLMPHIENTAKAGYLFKEVESKIKELQTKVLR